VNAPSTQRTSLDEALTHISSEAQVWVRLAAIQRDDTKWHLRLLELTSGAPPPSWKLMTWDYPWAVLTGGLETGRTVSEWIQSSSMTLEGREIVLSKAMETLLWERRQSGSPSGFEKLDWPVAETTLIQSDSTGDPPGPLVSAADAPSFINFYTAAACFFYLDRQPVGGSLHQGVMYRHQDTRGRLRSVRIAGSEIAVDVEGSDVGAMAVELAGDAPGEVRRLASPDGRSAGVKFTLADGLPAGAWLLLRRGPEWIDRRHLTTPWSRSAEAGVEYVVEPQTRLEAFLTNRENDMVEFKRQVPSENASKVTAMKTVCAFANGNGGSILFGVDDELGVIGVEADTVDRLKDQLTQMVGSWVEPRPRVAFHTLPFGNENRVVLEMRVEAGPQLYGSRARRGDTPLPYIRHQAITVLARPNEIEDIVRARTGPVKPSQPW
jgi:Schlafen, AlbA_2